MWQIIVAAAAAVAGSGILAKKLVNPKDSDHETSSPPDSNNNNNVHYNYDQILSLQNPPEQKFNGEIFRFSSSNERGKGKLKRNKKKTVSVEKDHQVGNVRGRIKVSVCFKKRRIGKHVAGKCESCASKDESFGWRVGLGMMYMMSVGKTEMSRLNCAMDETARVVQELKYEISKRKLPLNMQAPVGENEDETVKELDERSSSNALSTKAGAKKNYMVTQSALSLMKECEFASTAITEEQEPEVMEMDQLEAEFESELQKLSWCATEGSVSGGRTDTFEDEVLAKDCQNSDSYQHNGVSPTELDEKLSHLLIEQQESQIEELEADLHHAHSKLNQKEAELQALKDCVKRLTQFSLASALDDEGEDHKMESQTRDQFKEKQELESSSSMVGMKRTMGFDSYICSAR